MDRILSKYVNPLRASDTWSDARSLSCAVEAQLMTATSNPNIISPALVQRLAAFKCQVEAESAALTLYKENNREDNTVNVINAAKAKLNEAQNQFKVIKKVLGACSAEREA